MPTITIGIFIMFVKFSLSFLLLLLFLQQFAVTIFALLSPPPIFNARALKLRQLCTAQHIELLYFCQVWAAPLGWPRPQGPPKSKTGSLLSFTSICIPEVSLNHRAPKLGRNVHLYRLSKISNVFFRTPGHARSASRNAKTRYWLLLSNYLR